MRNYLSIVFFLSLIANTFAQNGVPGACGKHSGISPMNGNGSLGQTYTNSACGLNYVYDSARVETRFDQYTTMGYYGCGLPCQWAITGIPSCYVLEKAYVWALVSYTSGTAPNATLNITNPLGGNNSYTNLPIGTDGPKCWGETGTAVYRWDVSTNITGNGNYSFNFTGFANVTYEMDGASLYIIYRDGGATYQGSLEIWDGAVTDGQSGAYVSQTMTGLNVCAVPSLARAFAISSDHQDNIGPTHPTTLNGVITNFPNNFYCSDETTVTLTAGQTTSLFAQDGTGSD